MTLIYHVCRKAEYSDAQGTGIYRGSSQDKADGFIHFSTAAQVAESVAKHRAGQTDLMIIEVDSDLLGPSLKWEPSRGGALFPHLYGGLYFAAITRLASLTQDEKGGHVLPWGLK